MIQRWKVTVLRKTKETWLIDAEGREDAEELALEKGGELDSEKEVDAFVQRTEPEEPDPDRESPEEVIE